MIAPAFALVSVCSVMSAQCRFFAGSQVKDSRTSWLKWGDRRRPGAEIRAQQARFVQRKGEFH
jgi:hypothetical protein